MTSKQSIVNPVANGKVRGYDKHGAGHYHAPRGTRLHDGIDIITTTGQDIVSPIDGTVTRKSYPYAGDLRYTGLLITGTGKHKDFEVKIWYMLPFQTLIGKPVIAGNQIGTAQDLTIKYPSITNHVHLQVKVNGKSVDPATLITTGSAAKKLLHSGPPWAAHRAIP